VNEPTRFQRSGELLLAEHASGSAGPIDPDLDGAPDQANR
jgi:hypothetical protein